jgi:hypothetical protein
VQRNLPVVPDTEARHRLTAPTATNEASKAAIERKRRDGPCPQVLHQRAGGERERADAICIARQCRVAGHQRDPRASPTRRNSGSVSRRSARITGPIRHRSISPRRLPGSHKPPALRMIGSNSRTPHGHHAAECAELDRTNARRKVRHLHCRRSPSSVLRISVSRSAISSSNLCASSSRRVASAAQHHWTPGDHCGDLNSRRVELAFCLSPFRELVPLFVGAVPHQDMLVDGAFCLGQSVGFVPWFQDVPPGPADGTPLAVFLRCWALRPHCRTPACCRGTGWLDGRASHALRPVPYLWRVGPQPGVSTQSAHRGQGRLNALQGSNLL